MTVSRERVFVCVGRTKESEQQGRVWCIDPTKRGDVSPELVFNQSAPAVPIPDKVPVACDTAAGDFTRPNPNSAAIWEYSRGDRNGDGEISIEERMHSSSTQVVVHKDLVFACDGTGIFHCLDFDSGQALWSFDTFANVMSAPLVSENHVFVTSEDGEVLVFGLSDDPSVAMPGGNPVHRVLAPTSITATAEIKNNVLYVLCRSMLYAIAEPPPE